MTNNLVLRSIEQFMSDFKPTYNPLMPLFLDRSKAYEIDVGEVNFKKYEAMGDLRARMYTPKDTEMHQIAVGSGSKKFKKYYFAAQYRQSSLQSREGVESVNSQVLDEHNIQNDELMITGEGTANNNVVNNGLYFSADPNYVTNSSFEVDKDNGGYLVNLYAKMISDIEAAEDLDGRLMVLTYGSVFMPQFNGLFPTNSRPLLGALSEAKPTVDFARMPSKVVPSGANGYLLINRDNITLHYTTLPKIMAQGVNEENMYAWTNYIMGSSMIDVEAKGAITRQPITFEA